ncbi:chromosome segregation protein SMC [Metabacillus iocasae]|uniref:Chromosome partition protein Smc n=1 Tax=Priestia iocasae TaxID=2291674 RepID=A0ABS2QQV2_9BACI|nr:chromosome segregation protein SMC [Metabacillus iocasae]MBM7701835.1 chromosome segregation protein [Metabacillus iocasae]
MFLKRLDVVGFKSFAEKVSIDFVTGVTAVVGPNGSGKSNITDAIRWVLGEQSAKSLRGAKMEDIIFAGSDTRKALNIAEVTLTLENNDHFLPLDFHEVSITRRVYRSGDSEFLINNQACRLKDIIDLFMDSGLGREAFSIISQGKVEEILSSKPEERRKIFEEAAGVLKYKTRKRKAELKLLETQENLNRVVDILHEIEGQLEPLKIQSSIAKDYLEKKEELKKMDVAVIVYEIEDLHAQWEALKEQFSEHQKLEAHLSEQTTNRETNIHHQRTNIQKIDESLEILHKHLLVTSEELEKLEGRKEVLKERKKNASQNKQQLERLVEEYKQKITELTGLRVKEENRLQKLEQTVKEMKVALEEKQRLFIQYSENLSEKLEQLKSEYFELLNEQTSSRNEMVFLEQQHQQTVEKQNRLTQTNEQYISEREDIKQRKEALTAKLSQLREQLNEAVAAGQKRKGTLESLKQSYQKKESNLYQAYQFVQQTKSRKEMLEDMQDDYAGYFQGVKEVLKARGSKLVGIEGAIAELIHVPKQYETALEIALGGATQHIVVEDDKSARSAIAFLKQSGNGRATFLPLTSVTERQLPGHVHHTLKQHLSFIGVASDLIEHDKRYSRVISNLLGTVIIVQDLKGANELARQTGQRYRFVTLEGDVVNPGGSMTGGSIKQKTNSLLGRQRELETITVKLQEMEEKTENLEQEVKEMKQAIHSLESDLAQGSEEVAQLKETGQQINHDIRELDIEEKAVNDRLTMYDHDIASFVADQNRIADRIAMLKQIVTTSTSTLEKLEKEIEAVTAQKNSQQLSKETVQSELTEIKIELAGREQSLTNQREKFNRITFELEQTKVRLAEVQEDLSFLTNEMGSNDSGELQLEEAAQRKLKEKNDALQQTDEQRAERLKRQNKLEEEERELKELQRQHKQVSDALKDEEVKINRLEVALDNRLQQLSEEYSLSFEAAKEAHSLIMPIDETRKKIKLVKMAIEELGTVNLGAIDEYSRISERYDFLSSQQSDLSEAKNTLYQVIEEMDEEMKKRFSQTFYRIREEFDEVFKSLFGGGKADLQLTNPKDLLNTGVDIVAQPPGKKLQNLGLLSGGERSLTAIALLFSILKVRPVPFCVLDEVEAALDEANVQRFSTYLKKFSHETQFIVITHRKGTMEEADVLYGVTMQESGVSKLVSVRLEDSKQYA